MTLAVVRLLLTGRQLHSAAELDDFEQRSSVHQYPLVAVAGLGVGDTQLPAGTALSASSEFAWFIGRHLWTAVPMTLWVPCRSAQDAARDTADGGDKALVLARFNDFVLAWIRAHPRHHRPRRRPADR